MTDYWDEKGLRGRYFGCNGHVETEGLQLLDEVIRVGWAAV